MTNKVATHQPKKTWYVIRWQVIYHKSGSPFFLPPHVCIQEADAEIVSFDETLENAKERIRVIAESLTPETSHVRAIPANGIIYKAEIAKPLTQTSAGTIQTLRGATINEEIRDLLESAEPICLKSFPVIKQVTGTELPQFNECPPAQCLVAYISVKDPITEYPLDILLVPIEVGKAGIYSYMEERDYYPDSSTVTGDRVLLATVLHPDLSQRLLKKKEIISLAHEPEECSQQLNSILSIHCDDVFPVFPETHKTGRFLKNQRDIAALSE